MHQVQSNKTWQSRTCWTQLPSPYKQGIPFQSAKLNKILKIHSNTAETIQLRIQLLLSNQNGKWLLWSLGGRGCTIIILLELIGFTLQSPSPHRNSNWNLLSKAEVLAPPLPLLTDKVTFQIKTIISCIGNHFIYNNILLGFLQCHDVVESQKCNPDPVTHCIYNPGVLSHHKPHSSHTPSPDNERGKDSKLNLTFKLLSYSKW